ncbi:hypothetical protein C1645_839793 [Glomus cerebriforme]|uniref:F-box/LRR-repeat protein 15-like leucin rich repeat domain-containing protein n=1 Tax=Glomus cerebriforme TaxID=658196 RepID=A0A397S680_9GLOM|nr:hypothetical protein C1645_839793 [Glomus cerebriforme]
MSNIAQVFGDLFNFIKWKKETNLITACKQVGSWSYNTALNSGHSIPVITEEDGDIDVIIGSYPNIVYLNFNATCKLAISDTAIINIAHSYPNLLRLELFECGYISDTAIKEIVKSCSRLEHLNLRVFSLISEDTICIIARSCQKLRFLDLMQCFSITDRAIKEIAKSCHKLEYLDIYGCGSSVTDLGIRAIACSCPKLKHLDLGNNSMIGNSAIREIARSFPNLKSLGLEYCRDISRKVIETEY